MRLGNTFSELCTILDITTEIDNDTKNKLFADIKHSFEVDNALDLVEDVEFDLLEIRGGYFYLIDDENDVHEMNGLLVYQLDQTTYKKEFIGFDIVGYVENTDIKFGMLITNNQGGNMFYFTPKGLELSGLGSFINIEELEKEC